MGYCVQVGTMFDFDFFPFYLQLNNMIASVLFYELKHGNIFHELRTTDIAGSCNIQRACNTRLLG